jgi:beta-glucosidase
MSVAWTRIIPSGLAGSPVNAAGVQFYKDLITELLKNGIVPAVTMFHCAAVVGDGGGGRGAERV